jgi:F-type H+-transporting ATPase subunit gamma
MKTISELKKDIDFNKNLRFIVEVMKSIAVAHYHMLERKIKVEERFYSILKDYFSFPHLQRAQHPFIAGGAGPAGIVAITSDMGLLGGLNMKVMAAAFDATQSGPFRLIVVGEKGHSVARDRGFSFVGFPGVKDDERFAQAVALRDYLADELMTGKIGSLAVYYPEPVSFLVQRIKKYSLVPFDIPEAGPGMAVHEKETILESDVGGIIEYLVYLWMGQAFFEILGFSRLSELSARYIHLENSSQKIQEVEKKLKLQYFRVRHELIDKSMREIFSSRSIYAG